MFATIRVTQLPASPVRLLRRVAGAYGWAWANALLALAFFAFTLAVSARIGVPLRDPEGALMGKRLVLPFVAMAAFFAIDTVLRARRMVLTGEWGWRAALRRVFLERWWWQRLAIVLAGFGSFHLSYLSYRNLKSFLPIVTGAETWDQQLLRMDNWLFFGNDPATLLHNLMGTTLSASFLSSVYLAFIPFVPISVAVAIVLANDLRSGYLYLIASNFCWILGAASYYVLPSLGPFAGKPSLFDDLSHTNTASLQNALMSHRLDLLRDPIGDNVVQGVAAFASLHIGIVFMAFLVAYTLGNRRLAWIMGAALVPTTLATVYFGWHYVIDDVAGLLIGYLAVAGARWMVLGSPRLRPSGDRVTLDDGDCRRPLDPDELADDLDRLPTAPEPAPAPAATPAPSPVLP